MTEREALKLALEALETLHDENIDYLVRNKLGGENNQCMVFARDVIKSIKRSLAQPEQEPVAWKLVPVEPTKEMLKAMDECSTEGYDERLYAGHAASVYMAAVDVAPTPPPVAEPHKRKPLTDEEIILIVAECASSHQHTDIHFARAIEAAHGIKGGI